MRRGKALTAARLLSAAGFVWCVVVSLFIWFMPIRSAGASTVIWSASGSPQGGSTRRVVPVQTSRRFADVSLFGPAPLVVPVVLAGLATWAVWGGRSIAALVTIAILLLFCFVAGFSIGPAYLLGGGALAGALAIVLASPSDNER